MANHFSHILLAFDLQGTFQSAAPFGSGHINDTYLVEIAEPTSKVVLQRINHQIFKDPVALMANIFRVTEHLRARARGAGEDVDRATLEFFKTRDGKELLCLPDGTFWRLAKLIEGARTYDQVESLHHVVCGSRAFGRFQQLMSDFPAEQLTETIPDFHHTPKRLEALKAAIAKDAAGRLKEVAQEVAYALDRKSEAGRIVGHMAAGEIPLRVTHNDTKFNNVMIDDVTGNAVCVIDLDTVMPGSALYDFGDSVRSGANSAAEDEPDLEKVALDMRTFEAFVEGYLDSARSFLVPLEIELLPFSAWLLTYECGVRFLTDHLNGDTYFRIHRPGHNLDRARNQFKLCQDMEARVDEMKAVVARYA